MDTDHAGEATMAQGSKEKPPKGPPKKRGPKRAEAAGFEGAELVSIGLNLPYDIRETLKLASLYRSEQPALKKRSSISAIVTEIIFLHLAELRKEAAEYLKIKAAKYR